LRLKAESLPAQDAASADIKARNEGSGSHGVVPGVAIAYNLLVSGPQADSLQIAP
jgi:hypothetical protein